jgi:RND family efflux transporter MFP subunit
LHYKIDSNHPEQTVPEWTIGNRRTHAGPIKNRECRRFLVYSALNLLLMCIFPVMAFAGPPGPGSAPPPAVVVAPVTEQDIVPATEYVGHVEAIQAVNLFAQVVGNIQSVHFEDGQKVKEGTRLFTIEQDIYKVRVSAADAALAQAGASYEGAQADIAAAESHVVATEADLDAVRAAFKRADKYLKRIRSVDARSIVQANLDSAISEFLQTKARVAQTKALIRQRESQLLQARALLKQAQARILLAQADLDAARINLAYTEIFSPITGRIGKAAATKGNYVGPGSGPLAHIAQMDPIRVVYSISENDLPAIQKALTDAGRPSGHLLAPELRLSNGEPFKPTGHVDFVDNQVDPGTGTIAVWAVFENPDGLLLPGQYVTILVKASAPNLVAVVPQSAVQQDREGAFVLVVDKENRVEIRRVKTGPVTGEHWAIESGLTRGDRVIVQGVQKARPGKTVKAVTAGKVQGR